MDIRSNARIKMAERFLDYLRRGQKEGTITRWHPAPSSRIIVDAEKSGIKLNDAEIRRFAHYLRAVKGEMVASIMRVNTDTGPETGYFLAFTASEYKESMTHMMSRVAKMVKAYMTPLQKYEHDQTLSLFDQHPVVLAIKKHFGAEVEKWTSEPDPN